MPPDELAHPLLTNPPRWVILVMYQRERTHLTTTPSTPDFNVPDTVNELIEQNTQPIPPEELFEKVKELQPTDIQIFSWNIVNQLVKFHEYVVNDMSPEDESYTTWVRDLEKLRMCSVLLDSLSE